MMTPKGEGRLPFSKTTLLECFNVCDVCSAPLSNPALTSTSRLALASCRGEAFNDFPKITELMQIQDLKPNFSTLRADVPATTLCWLPMDQICFRESKLTIEFCMNNCSFISGKTPSKD